jgi:hypothetical protein
MGLLYSCGSRVSIRTTSPPSISSAASNGSISSIVWIPAPLAIA